MCFLQAHVELVYVILHMLMLRTCITCVFAAHINAVWIKMKIQTKIRSLVDASTQAFVRGIKRMQYKPQ